MRSILIGSVYSSKIVLEEMIRTGFPVDMVFSLDPRYSENVSGYYPIHELAAENNIPYTLFRKIGDEENIEIMRRIGPDYIFVIPQGKEDEAMESFKAQFENNPVWSELSAVREGRMFIMPKDYFQYKPNAKWDLAYEYVLDLLKAA